MKILIWIVSLAALALALAIFAAGPGTRFGLWDYGTGLTILGKVAAPIKIAGPLALSPIFTAAALALIGAVAAAITKHGRLAVFALLTCLVAAGAGYIPVKMQSMAMSNPFIHDITTDFDDPPQIIAAANEERRNPPAYDGDAIVKQTGETVAESQRKAFPDIVPMMSDADLQTAAKAAREVVDQMGLKVLAEGPASDAAGSGWRIEAAATSFWYGFKDDFIVRLRPQPDGGTRIDVRSESRVGGSDLGQNAARVRKFLKALDAKI